MNDEIVTARNTEDGTTGIYPRNLVDHPVLGEYLEEVEWGSKPIVSIDDLVVQHFDLPDREDAEVGGESSDEDSEEVDPEDDTPKRKK